MPGYKDIVCRGCGEVVTVHVFSRTVRCPACQKQREMDRAAQVREDRAARIRGAQLGPTCRAWRMIYDPSNSWSPTATYLLPNEIRDMLGHKCDGEYLLANGTRFRSGAGREYIIRNQSLVRLALSQEDTKTPPTPPGRGCRVVSTTLKSR